MLSKQIVAIAIVFAIVIGCGTRGQPKSAVQQPRITIRLPAASIGDSSGIISVEQQVIPLGEPFGVEARFVNAEKNKVPIAFFILEFVRVDSSGTNVIENSAIVVPTIEDDGSLLLNAVITAMRNAGEITLRVRTNEEIVAEYLLKLK